MIDTVMLLMMMMIMMEMGYFWFNGHIFLVRREKNYLQATKSASTVTLVHNSMTHIELLLLWLLLLLLLIFSIHGNIRTSFTFPSPENN